MLDTQAINNDLLDACKEALKCIARLTPFPVGDQPPELLRAINHTADYADEVRATLRQAIAKAEQSPAQDFDLAAKKTKGQ